MLGHLAYADGSPSTTLVLSAAEFPEREEELVLALEPVRAWLSRTRSEAITKVALIGPAQTPECDLDYRFVQLLPGRRPGIELRGSCGHSILAALVCGAIRGWTVPLRAGRCVRVNVVNNGDRVLCEVDLARPPMYTVSVCFQRPRPLRTDDLLLAGEPVTMVAYRSPSARPIPVSLVSAGNPYVFVDASDLGVKDIPQLFAYNPGLFNDMRDLRRVVTELLGWPPEGAFPKIAALLPAGRGQLAVRAITVPSWHPTIALTGAACMAAAAGISDTIPQLLAHCEAAAGKATSNLSLRIRTPGGFTEVSATFDRDQSGVKLLRARVRKQLVRDLGVVDVGGAVVPSGAIAAVAAGG